MNGLKDTDEKPDNQEGQNAPEEPEQEKPQLVFGMTRSHFHWVAGGIAVGFILSGVVSLLFHIEVSSMFFPIVCGAGGYGICYLLDKKSKK